MKILFFLAITSIQTVRISESQRGKEVVVQNVREKPSYVTCTGSEKRRVSHGYDERSYSVIFTATFDATSCSLVWEDQ